ncbi:MAG: hypothetical protein MUF72_11330 [Elainella sp. Prado103]|jgi:hypothetical protein|nr:hypothetical protein [Elainella sp. Prado103]
MKSGLKRIEATLDQLRPQDEKAGVMESGTQEPDSSDPKAPSRPVSSKSSLEKKEIEKKDLAGKPAKTIQPFPIPKTPPIATSSTAQSQITPALVSPSQSTSGSPSPATAAIGRAQPLAAAQPRPSGMRLADVAPDLASDPSFPSVPVAQSLALPKSKPPSFSKHRHAVNPELAIGLLKEIETVVVNWQLSLEQTVLEIQALYLDGPIVDGWLESHPYGSPQVMQPIGTATLRHAEIDRLMDYVEEICRVPPAPETGELPRTGYRLCGLDADGQLWSRPCPAQQVPYVSLAIARYQKLRILLAKKQALENRLNQLIQNLTRLHGQIQEPLC